MKFYIKILSVALLFLMACNKKLDIEPKQSIDAATAITSAEDVEAAVVGAYSIMGGPNLYGTNLLMVPDLLASTGYVSWLGSFGTYRQVARKTLTRDNAVVSATWQSAYAAINSANIVLSSLDVVDDADIKTQYEGEALFIRGIMHFELVRLYALPWGAASNNDQPGVVIRTSATTTEEQAFTQMPRSTVAQVYEQVITDLKAAVDKLPGDNGTRADKYAALAFLSRVYLQQSDYKNALTAANEVIQSDSYKLNASVRAAFDNKNTAESIWEIQQNDQNNAGTSNSGLATFYASLPGVGRADVQVNNNFYNLYSAGDFRKEELIYLGTGARAADTANGVFSRYSGKWRSFSQNIPVIRIAEMYLIRAECNLRLGTTVGDTPKNDLAKIRNPVRTGLPIIADPTLDTILLERRLELAFEGVRIHDIKRLQQATGNFQWNDSKLVFPIPQRDVDASGGIIEQNPGY